MTQTKPMTSAEKTRRQRERLRAVGGKVLTVNLTPEGATHLKALKELYRCSDSAIVNKALEYYLKN